MTLLLVGVGGFLGAVARYAVDGVLSRATGGVFPYGTLVVNVSGSFLVGLVYALAIERVALGADVRAPVMIGFIGAYTTFSTWMLESWRLAEGGALIAAALNIGGSVVLGVVAVFAGLVVGRLV